VVALVEVSVYFGFLFTIFFPVSIFFYKVHQRSLNLLWCHPDPKLAKCSSRSSNLPIVSYESQIYLNNSLNLLRPWDRAMLLGTSRTARSNPVAGAGGH
jgi:hypothetical protein